MRLTAAEIVTSYKDIILYSHLAASASMQFSYLTLLAEEHFTLYFAC